MRSISSTSAERAGLTPLRKKLLVSTRDRDAVLADNDDLRAELGLYKSVAVAQDAKPRTTITRVTRLHDAPAPSEPEVPASSSTASRTSQSSSGLRSVSSGSRLASVPELPSASDFGGDMTLDDIMSTYCLRANMRPCTLILSSLCSMHHQRCLARPSRRHAAKLGPPLGSQQASYN